MDPRDLNQLKTLDSLIKESQRYGGSLVTSFPMESRQGRHTIREISIPASTLVMVPSLAVFTDEFIYPDAEVFHWHRYYALRPWCILEQEDMRIWEGGSRALSSK